MQKNSFCIYCKRQKKDIVLFVNSSCNPEAIQRIIFYTVIWTQMGYFHENFGHPQSMAAKMVQKTKLFL